MYHNMDHKEAYEVLRKAGFNNTQIDRLTQFRRRFSREEKDQTSTEHRRLEFTRWLFQTGKLTDYVA